MSLTRTLAFLLLAQSPAPLPLLRVEATDGGSALNVRNTGTQPLIGFLIELVNYPGSYYSLWQDDVSGEPIAPGVERRIPIVNMTVGAAPEYVKLTAAVFADGSTSGIPEKVTQFIERRKHVLSTTRELIRRLEAKNGAAELKQWASSIPAPTRTNRFSQEAINQAAAKSLINDTAARLEKQPVADVLTRLRESERALAASKPAL